MIDHEWVNVAYYLSCVADMELCFLDNNSEEP